MKNKNKLLPLIIILSIVFTGMNVTAGVIVDNSSEIIYPESVRLGDIFDITIAFNYESAADCLYGPKISLSYKLSYPSLALIDEEYKTILEPEVPTVALGRPDSITISIDSSAILAGIEDETVIFTFHIQYDTGFLYYVGGVAQVSKVDTVYTDWHELSMNNTPRIISNVPLLYLIAGSALLAIILIIVIYYLIKKRK